MESPVSYGKPQKDPESGKKPGLKLPPDRGTLGYLDMLIHDCRQYLYIKAGVIDDITQEGPMENEQPTDDIFEITDRLEKLKSMCMQSPRVR